MSVYGGFSVPQLELTYNAYLERTLFLLVKRVIWNIKDGTVLLNVNSNKYLRKI